MGVNFLATGLFDYQHEQNRKTLPKKINSLIQSANDKELQLIFRILKSILKWHFNVRIQPETLATSADIYTQNNQRVLQQMRLQDAVIKSLALSAFSETNTPY